VATMSPEELQERVKELEAEMRERAVESLQTEVEATEARLEVALRAELRQPGPRAGAQDRAADATPRQCGRR
jgi:hypothetical protein